MIPKDCKRLAEVDFPIAEVSRHAAREKYPDGATPIAYLWSRIVRCESPNCGAEIPLARSSQAARSGAGRDEAR